jgi:hypothetical protein
MLRAALARGLAKASGWDRRFGRQSSADQRAYRDLHSGEHKVQASSQTIHDDQSLLRIGPPGGGRSSRRCRLRGQHWGSRRRISWLGSGDRRAWPWRFDIWAPSTVLKVSLTETWNAHEEYLGLFSDNSRDDFVKQYVSPGSHYLLTPNLDVGVRVGWGLTDEAANFFSDAGLAGSRIQALRWHAICSFESSMPTSQIGGAWASEERP